MIIFSNETEKGKEKIFETQNSKKGQIRIREISRPEKVVVLVLDIKWWEATQQELLLNQYPKQNQAQFSNKLSLINTSITESTEFIVHSSLKNLSTYFIVMLFVITLLVYSCKFQLVIVYSVCTSHESVTMSSSNTESLAPCCEHSS